MYKNKLLILCLITVISGLNTVVAQENRSTKTKQNVKKNLSVEDQRKFDYYFYDAINAKATENSAAAYDYLKHCMSIDSTNANVLFELGNFYTSMQDKDRAYKYYGKAVYYDANNFYYNMALAAISLEKQEYKKAAGIYSKLIAENPTKIELYMYLSEAYRLDGDLINSIEALNDLERTMGMNEKITIQKFKLYAALNDKKKAYAEVQKYIDKHPDDVRYYILLGNLYLDDGNQKEAYKAFNKAKSMDPDNPLLITSLANYYEKIGDKEKAEQELQTSLFNPQVDIDTKIGILTQYVGVLQKDKQDIQKANVLVDSLTIKFPQETKLNLFYGNLLMIQGKKKEANFQYRIYTDSDPTNSLGWEQLLQSTNTDSIEALIDVCKSAISYVPEEPLFYFYLSVGEYEKKDYQGALKTLDKGIKYVDEKNTRLISEFHSQRGNLFYEMKKPDSAFVEYDKALKYDPQNLGVLNNYAYYLSLDRNKLDKAEKMSSITIKAEPTNPTYLDTYGWILFEQGVYSMAKIYLEKAIKYGEEKENLITGEVYEHYGDVLFKTGETDKALEYWQKAKEKGSESKNLDEKIKTKTYIENKK